MASSRILFCDIVGFSKLTVDKQVTFTNLLNAEMSTGLHKWLSPSQGQPEIIGLPTGDGLALVFLKSERPSWDFKDIFKIAIQLTQLSHKEKLLLRLGIHSGEVEIVTDINGRSNVCGDAINMAQRVMNAANDGQVLLSGDFINQHIGVNGTLKIEQNSQYFELSTGSRVQVFAKHNRMIEVVPIGLKDAEGSSVPGWDDSIPDSTRVLPISLTPLPKAISVTNSNISNKSFLDHLVEAQSIALVQLTGENLLRVIEKSEILFSENLERFWVFMPHPDSIKEYGKSAPMNQLELLTACIQKWKEILIKIQSYRPKAHIKLGLFRQPPFLGGSFIDWNKNGGKIHISPYIWEVPAKECPGFDLERKGETPHPVLAAYIRGLEALNEETKNELSWNKA